MSVGLFLYLDETLGRGALVQDQSLAALGGPLVGNINIPKLAPCANPLERATEAGGLILQLSGPRPGLRCILLGRQAVVRGLTTLLHTPSTGLIQPMLGDELTRYFLLWFYGLLPLPQSLRAVVVRLFCLVRLLPPSVLPLTQMSVEDLADSFASDSELPQRVLAHVRRLRAKAKPVPLRLDVAPSPEKPLPGTGFYVRTDFWARNVSGGSYAHTCYVAKELARVTGRLECHMAAHYDLLDTMGLTQLVMEPPGMDGNETNILKGSDHYFRLLKPLVQRQRPCYLYERHCLGNFTLARLSQELGIPYILEYNGSEISLKRSFDVRGYDYEEIYAVVEDLIFAQATIITVVSSIIRDQLVERGVDPAKIVVNPNGVDTDDYRPAEPAERESVRDGLGIAPERCVVCFTGSFGGWHGVGTLAKALPLIAREAPQVDFLLIGDGAYKYLVDEMAQAAGIGDRVIRTGRVPQEEGRRLLFAADIFISPHDANMVDSRFFGSPTKIFEYLAMGRAIVASDLEQIGEILSPALRLLDLRRGQAKVGDERSVLCSPGDVEEFAQCVIALSRSPETCRGLGLNARKAALGFSWGEHVAKFWRPLLPCRVPGGKG